MYMKKAIALKRGPTSDPIMSLRSEVNEFFDNWFEEFGRSMGGTRPLRLIKNETLSNWPRVDLVEENNRILVTAEIPGFTEKDIDINVTRDLLTITGSCEESSQKEDLNYHVRERYLESFERTIPLPVDVEVDGCEAEFRNGLLNIRLPKARGEGKQVHKVKIKSV